MKRFFVVEGEIFIVEDDKKTANLIALYIERKGFQTGSQQKNRTVIRDEPKS